MTDRKLDIPSNCPSPARIEKSDSSSSRQSGSPPNWEFESFIISEHSCRGRRTRRSSWDDSDETSSPELERCVKPSRLYSSDIKKSRSSITAEINQLKKQYFESMEKLKVDADNREMENLKEMMKLNDDRRHSPARVRRRTKSSSSSSPVPETKSPDSPKNSKKLNDTDVAFDEISSKISELDPKIYLNNFFTQLKTKRISMVESSAEEKPTYDADCFQMYNEDANEDEAFFCKTFRKLSQILEVEETKKDFEEIGKIEQFSPLQTARSRKSEKILKHFENNKPKNFKSISFEHFRQLKKPFEGSLSERTQSLDYCINDFITLSAKTGKTQLTLPKWPDSNDARPLEYVCLGGNSRESTPNNKFSTSEHPTDRTDRSHTSGKSKRSSNLESPKLAISLERDSARSFKVEDVKTPDSLRQETERNSNAEFNESESSDSKPEIILENLDSGSKSSKEFSREKRNETPENSVVGSNRSYLNSRRFKEPERSLKSYRSLKIKTPPDKETSTSRSDKIPELDLQLEKSDSHRSVKSNESNRSETRQRTPRSGRSFSPKSRRSTPRGLKITPVTSSSSRSKDSLEEQNVEILRTAAWKELEKVCDTLGSQTSASSISRKELETVIRQSPESNGSVKNPRANRQSFRKSSDSLESVSRATSRDTVDEQSSDISEKYEEPEELKEPLPTQRSEKRLSIINEVSSEDLVPSNPSIEKKEEEPPKITPRIVSLKGKFNNKTGLQFDNGKWNELINKFSPKSSTNRDLDFSWKAFNENENENENSDESSRLVESHYEPVEKKFQLEKEMKKKNDVKNSDLGYPKSFIQTMIQEKRPYQVQNSQNLYYLNVDKKEPFSIGEFGDMASWNTGKTDTPNHEKPKDHGDGIQTPQLLIISGKREKEVKTQRQLWTEVKEDFRISFLDDSDFHRDLKTSKSDVIVGKKTDEENRRRVSSIYKLNKQDIIEKKLLEFENYRNFKETPNKKTSSSESLISEKVESEHLEFEIERTPRLSRSLDDLDTRENQNLSNDSLNTSETQLFHKTFQSEKNESTNLKIFLAQKEKDKIAIKSSNWLNITDENSRKGKKTNKNRKESSSEYLSSGKMVPKLKFRNTNCFQNFYKRFISVFCLTSHSSAATSE